MVRIEIFNCAKSPHIHNFFHTLKRRPLPGWHKVPSVNRPGEWTYFHTSGKRVESANGNWTHADIRRGLYHKQHSEALVDMMNDDHADASIAERWKLLLEEHAYTSFEELNLPEGGVNVLKGTIIW